MKKFMTVLAVVALVAFAAPAFAANPFADVPAGHWAYDAVAQLAADGLISGYPDGQFKGPQKATRYEVAAMVARAVARGDELHASKKDIELLKKLMVEFKDELDALGAKVDKIDKRVGKLEKGIGSWKISGRLKFDVKEMSTSEDGWRAGNQSWNDVSKHEWNKDTARLFFRRQINDTTYFDSQLRIGAWASGQPSRGNKGRHKGMGESTWQTWNKFYISTKLPFWGLNVKIGRSQFDWEDYYGLYNDEDAFFGDWRLDGFWFEKSWKTVKLDAVAGRNFSGAVRNYARNGNDNINTAGDMTQLYGLNIKWTPTDKLTLGAMGYWQQGDGKDACRNAEAVGNIQTYGVTAGYKFTKDIALKGIYYWQKYNAGAVVDGTEIDDSNYAFKVILDIKQSVLKFTDLWVEYAQFKNGFGANNGANDQVNCWSLGGTYNEPGIMWVRPINNEVTKVWFISAAQKWTKKWSTFVRFNQANFGTDGVDNAWEWGIGVKYKLNPAITLTLAYDQINYGDNVYAGETAQGGAASKGKDNVVFFQTDVKF